MLLRTLSSKLFVPGPAVSAGNFHTVEAGQTFYSISKLHHLTVKELLALNHLNKIVTVSVGQKLIVNRQSSLENTGIATAANVAQPRSSTGSAHRTHIVTPGETVFRISQNYHVSIEDIQKLNNLSGYTIKVGQKIKLP